MGLLKLKEDKEYYVTQMKEDKESYVEQIKLLKKEWENQKKRQNNAKAQYMELMQKCLLVVAQQEKMKYEILLKEWESQHTKEIEEIWKVYADQVKVHEENCKTTTAEIPTTQEKQQQNHHDDKDTREEQRRNNESQEAQSEPNATQQKVCRGSECSCDNLRMLNDVRRLTGQRKQTQGQKWK